MARPKLAVQKTADGTYVFFAAGVPGKGYKTYIVKEEAADTTPSMEVSTEVMENEYFKVEYNEKRSVLRRSMIRKQTVIY